MMSFDSALTEMAVTYILSTGQRLSVRVYKIGGGTVGRRYGRELWAVQVKDETTGKQLLETEDFYVGPTVSHSEAIGHAMSYLPAGMQPQVNTKEMG